jgi:hypothetical protein
MEQHFLYEVDNVEEGKSFSQVHAFCLQFSFSCELRLLQEGKSLKLLLGFALFGFSFLVVLFFMILVQVLQ